MLALGIGVILSVIVKAVLVIALVLGGAYALTTYVKLPGFVDTLIWIGAGGYAFLCVIGVVVAIGALIAAGNATSNRGRIGRLR
jgi:hypothetical protein